MLTRRSHRPFRRAATTLLPIIAILAALAMLSSAPATGAAQGSAYHPTDLGSLDGLSGNSVAHDINKHGQIVGFTDTADGARHAFLYDDGVMTDLGTLGGYYSVALAINDAGQVVGAADLPNGDSHAFLWQNGVMTDLGTLGGSFSQANDINNRGQIVGQADLKNGRTHAFLWKQGKMTDLGTLRRQGVAAPNSVAEAINDNGRIVGWGDAWSSVTRGFTDTHAILWKTDGSVVDLDPGLGHSMAFTVNKHGAIAGRALLRDQATGRVTTYAVRWDKQLAIHPGPANATVYALNDHGQMVGQTDASTPILWSGGSLTELPAIDGLYGSANGISNQGVIVGEAEKGSIPVRATLWER